MWKENIQIKKGLHRKKTISRKEKRYIWKKNIYKKKTIQKYAKIYTKKKRTTQNGRKDVIS